MPATVPLPCPTPQALTGWAFIVGRRTRERLELAVAFPDGRVAVAGGAS
jgi:hypothetical protein